MTIYLIIITTVLVLTQIIRVIQNAMQLKRLEKISKRDNDIVIRVYEKWEKWLDKEGKAE